MKEWIFISLLEYFFPPRCVFCNTILAVGAPIYICRECAGRMEYFNNCLNPLNLPRGIETYCDGMICVGRYNESLKNSLKRFKFSGKPSYYRAFGRLLAVKLQNTLQEDMLDIVIPVPLYKGREKQRGYNQAGLIAGYAAGILGKPLLENILVKVSDSKSQSMLSRNERMTNVEDLFSVKRPKAVKNKKILLVDDIITTGSTVNQCCKVLKQAGASSVVAGVIATTRSGSYK